MVTQPPGALSDVHDRAPVVLSMGDWARWLDLDADVDALLGAEPADRFEVRPFTPFASDTGNLKSLLCGEYTQQVRRRVPQGVRTVERHNDDCCATCKGQTNRQ